MKKITLPALLLVACVYLFLYAPLAVVMAYSLNAAKYGLAWKGFSLQWYLLLFQDSAVLLYAKNTLLLATVSTAIATVIGSLLGFSLARTRQPFRAVLEEFLAWPLFIPDMVMAVSLLLFFHLARAWTGWFAPGLPTMIAAHATFQIPFVAVIVQARALGLDPALEEAAHDLGADAWDTFRLISLPLLWPGIVAGALVAFTLSLDDFIISFFTSGPGSTTLPIYIYSSVKRGVTAEVNAAASLLVMASTAAVVAWALLRRKSEFRI